jgi:hypothetical protein
VGEPFSATLEGEGLVLLLGSAEMVRIETQMDEGEVAIESISDVNEGIDAVYSFLRSTAFEIRMYTPSNIQTAFEIRMYTPSNIQKVFLPVGSCFRHRSVEGVGADPHYHLVFAVVIEGVPVEESRSLWIMPSWLWPACRTGLLMSTWNSSAFAEEVPYPRV